LKHLKNCSKTWEFNEAPEENPTVQESQKGRKMNHLNSVSSIFDLSPPEKLQLVEDLWEDPAAAPSEVPVHEWQKKELALRKTSLMREPSSGLLWDEVKQRIRTRYAR
jgi:putative addiction module component (TIGR02574 family)